MEIIQPKIQQNITTAFKGKLLTCAYCRVSTSSELQLNSYDAQVKHYTEFIQNNTEWEFVGVYSDEGMSGTSVKKRAGFMKMIADAKNGKINLIICKSISRFGRNTTDILNYIRLLKKYNVAVFFENENINTLTAIGEVLITILASLAQDGSRQISENVNWGIDKAFKNGKVFGNNKALGYEIKDGEIVIIEEEAKIVRLIFDSYLNGDGAVKIAKKLDEMKIPTPLKSKRWNATTSQISRIEKLIETLNNDEFNEDFVRNCINKIIITKDIYKVYLNDLDTCLSIKPDELSAFIYPTQDVLLNRYKCNMNHLFSKYSNLKENYSDITVELYIAV